MLVLAFDTTSENGGVAVYCDQQCLASEPNRGPANRYSVSLFQMLDRVLDEAHLSLRAIQLFAVAKGPGSFTGIRVGLAAAQGWASAFGRPVKGVSILEAMVEAVQPEANLAVPILDARRGEFFLGTFRRRAGSSINCFQQEDEGAVLKPSALLSYLEGSFARPQRLGTVRCLVLEHDQAAQALRERLPDSVGWEIVPGNLLEAIATLALRASRDGKLESPAELDACYIRRSDAELHFQRGRGQVQSTHR